MQGHKSDEFILESKLDFSARTIKHYDCVLLHFNCEREKTGGSLPKWENMWPVKSSASFSSRKKQAGDSSNRGDVYNNALTSQNKSAVNTSKIQRVS